MDKKLLNRKLYKQVKRMDRQEMEEFLESIYLLGFQDGAEASQRADFKIKLVQVLDKTKGVGEKTIEKVLDTLKEQDLDKYGLNTNPWVWVIEFERLEG